MRRRFGAALLVAGVLGSPSPGAAQPAPGWKPFGLQGSTVRSLAAAPDKLCAGTQSDGVFCRALASSGAIWVSRGPAGVTIASIWIDPVFPDVMFAAASGPPGTPRVLRSLNGGAMWAAADAGLTGPIAAVRGVPGTQTLYAQGGSVWRSDDRGGSWHVVFPDSSAGVSLDVAPTNPAIIWAGGETLILSGYTVVSYDGGAQWEEVWNSYTGPGAPGDNQTADIAAHPTIDGLVITGHEGFVLRTLDHGAAFTEVLTAPARFYLGWDGGDPTRAYGSGSPNGGGGHAYVSRDLGQTWMPITGALAPRTVFDLAADRARLGVAYAATDDGIQRFYGGGDPLCLDTRLGIDSLRLIPGPCTSPAGGAAVVPGDAIAGHIGALRFAGGRVDLGEVECLVDGADIALADIDPPEPPQGEALFILVRLQGASDYGTSSSGQSRRPSLGDCAP